MQLELSINHTHPASPLLGGRKEHRGETGRRREDKRGCLTGWEQGNGVEIERGIKEREKKLKAVEDVWWNVGAAEERQRWVEPAGREQWKGWSEGKSGCRYWIEVTDWIDERTALKDEAYETDSTRVSLNNFFFFAVIISPVDKYIVQLSHLEWMWLGLVQAENAAQITFNGKDALKHVKYIGLLLCCHLILHLKVWSSSPSVSWRGLLISFTILLTFQVAALTVDMASLGLILL